jgi:hypothetical protein
MLKNFFPANAEKLSSRAVVRVFLGAIFGFRNSLITEFFVVIKSPVNRALPPIPLNSARLVMESIGVARTTTNSTLRNQLCVALEHIPYPAELAVYPCYLPFNGVFQTNDVVYNVRFSNADETHIQDCLDTGVLKRAIYHVREYYRTSGLQADYLDTANLVHNTERLNLDKYTMVANLVRNPQSDISRYTCRQAGALITDTERLPDIATEPDGTRQVVCIDENSNLIGRYFIDGTPRANDLVWFEPTGYNAWSWEQFFSLFYSGKNIPMQKIFYLTLTFGFFFNPAVALTVVTTNCLRNFLRGFSAYEQTNLASELVMSVFGNPEPAKPVNVETTVVRAELQKNNIIINQESFEQATPNKTQKPKTLVVDGEGQGLNQKPSRTQVKGGQGRTQNNDQSSEAQDQGPTKRKRKQGRDVSTNALNYRPLNKQSLERNRLINAFTDFLLQKGFLTKPN